VAEKWQTFGREKTGHLDKGHDMMMMGSHGWTPHKASFFIPFFIP
jgi:hypothetical protein